VEKVKIGIVGLGLMGKMYADALHDNRFVDLVAVADTDDESLSFAQKRYSCKRYNSYNQMYKDADLDAVVIVLPDSLHKEAVRKAANAGLHIWVEKPFATSAADAKEMYEAVQKAGVKCTVEFFNRWSKPFTRAWEMVRNNELGDVLSYNIELNDPISAPTEMLKWSSQSSPVWFLMTHTADLAFWILNKKPVSVYAQGVKKELVKRGVDTYDLVEALVEYDDGSLGRLTNCWVLPNGMPIGYELKMRIVGSKSAIDINTSDQQLHHITHEKYTHPITDWANVLGNYVGHPYTMLNSFVMNIVDDTPCLIDEKVGLDNTIFLETVHNSLKTGNKLEVPWS